MDTETAEEVLTLRGRRQLVSNTNGFNPRVRFSPDGRELVAACHDVSDVLAVWSSLQDTPANSRRVTAWPAVARSRATSPSPGSFGGSRRTANGPRTPRSCGTDRPGIAREFLTRASKLIELDLWDQADAELDRAVARRRATTRS